MRSPGRFHRPAQAELCIKLNCIVSRRMTSSAMNQKTKSEKDLARATLAKVTREMARPRFAESAREEEEEANRRVGKHESVSPEVRRKKPAVFLCHALLSSIVVIMIGFLGFGVRAFSTPDLTRLVFGGLVIVSVGILALYFMRRRSARESTAHSVRRESPFANPSIFSRLSGWTTSGLRWMRSVGPILSRVWHRIGDSFLPRKAPMKPGERMSAEAGVVRVPKVATSRRAA